MVADSTNQRNPIIMEAVRQMALKYRSLQALRAPRVDDEFDDGIDDWWVNDRQLPEQIWAREWTDALWATAHDPHARLRARTETAAEGRRGYLTLVLLGADDSIYDAPSTSSESPSSSS